MSGYTHRVELFQFDATATPFWPDLEKERDALPAVLDLNELRPILRLANSRPILLRNAGSNLIDRLGRVEHAVRLLLQDFLRRCASSQADKTSEQKPLHFDSPFAMATPFPAPFQRGRLSMALIEHRTPTF